MERIYLQQARLINFQSWSDATIDLSPGLNLLIADNGVGKTSFLRALSIVLSPEKYTKKDRGKYIAWGKESAIVAYIFSDGSAYRIDILRNANGYYKFNPSNNGWIYMGMEVPEELIEKLGIIKYEGVIGNLIDLSKEKFLVNTDELKDDTLFKMVLSNDDLDKVREVISEQKLPLVDYNLKLNKQTYDYTKGIMEKTEFVDVSELEKNVEIVDNSMNTLEALDRFYEGLDSLKKVSMITNRTVSCINSISSLIELEKCLEQYTQKPMIEFKYSGLVNNLNNLIEFNENFQSLNYVKELSKEKCLLNSLEMLLELDKINPIKTCKVKTESIDILSKLNLLNISMSPVIDLMREKYLIEKEKKELNKLGGEEFDCPINGKIKLVNGECVPSNC